MYCKNCGNAMDDIASFCENCGCAKGTGMNYCANCGSELSPEAAVCITCGYAAGNGPTFQVKGTKSKMAAGLLGIFLGSLGIHNFYLGYTGKGVCQLLISLLTCGTLSFISGIWGLVEGIMILCGNINVDADGNLLSD